ncbi:hypothetical protein IMZ48_02080, partial [Candidatus Bathyarchaeota archaeon]|nr:hypothetical protein [Candidatus Bathyarchaeota archaeon]
MQSTGMDDVLTASAPERPPTDGQEAEKGPPLQQSPDATPNDSTPEDTLTIPLSLHALNDAFSLTDLLLSKGVHTAPPSPNPKHQSPFD